MAPKIHEILVNSCRGSDADRPFYGWSSAWVHRSGAAFARGCCDGWPGAVRELRIMNEGVNSLARELAEAIGSAVAEDSRVEACREKARLAGYDMRVSLEAEIGFSDHESSSPPVEFSEEAHSRQESDRSFEVTANDRRFLRSLGIAAEADKQRVD